MRPTGRPFQRGTTTGSVLALALAVMPEPHLHAQNMRESGPLLTFTFGQSVVWSDDPDDVGADSDRGAFSRTALGFALQSQTRSQSLGFEASGNLEYGAPLESTGLVDPALRFAYSRMSANARLDAFAQFRTRDVGDTDGTIDIDLDGDGTTDETSAITFSGGRREILRYGLGFETGLRSPFGLELDFDRIENRYADTDDPDLFDTTTTRVTTIARFRIDPRAVLRTTASQTLYEAKDDVATERTTTRFGLGGTFLIDPVLTLDAVIGWQQIETDRTTGRGTREGATLDVALIRTLRNGTLQAAISSGINQNGRTREIRLTRALALSSGAELSFSAGAGRAGDGDFQPLLGLSYAHELRASRITASFDQRIRTDNDDTDIIDTRLRATYARDLTQNTGMTVRVGLSDRDAQSNDGTDRRRLDIGVTFDGRLDPVSLVSAGVRYVQTSIDGATDRERESIGLDISYRRAVMRDLDLVASYDFTARSDSLTDDTEESTISLGFEKAFSIRP